MQFSWVMRIENEGFVGGDYVKGGALVEDYSQARRFDSIENALLFLFSFQPEKKECRFSATFPGGYGGPGFIQVYTQGGAV